MRLTQILFPILALALFAGCEAPAVISHPWPKTYRLVRVSNPRGELIADWIAVGSVNRAEGNSYRFKAVERISAPPNSEDIHYPEGRLVTIYGPTMIVSRCGKPQWLYEFDGY